MMGSAGVPKVLLRVMLPVMLVPTRRIIRFDALSLGALRRGDKPHTRPA